MSGLLLIQLILETSHPYYFKYFFEYMLSLKRLSIKLVNNSIFFFIFVILNLKKLSNLSYVHFYFKFTYLTGGGSSQASAPPKFVDQDPPPVDASKAPGYRGTAVCSPVSSKTSSNSTTPPTIPIVSSAGYQNYTEQKSQPLPPIGSNIIHSRPVTQTNQNDISGGHFYANNELPTRSMQHLTISDTSNIYKGVTTSFTDNNSILNDGSLLQQYHASNSMQHMNFSQSQQVIQPAVSMSRLNPKAPDFSSSLHSVSLKQSTPSYNGYPVNNQNNSSIYPMGK